MTEITTIELTKLLQPESLERLQNEAERQQVRLPELVRGVIETYLEALDDDEEYEDTPDEEILAGFRQAWHEAMTGAPTQPAREVLEEIRREIAQNDDES